MSSIHTTARAVLAAWDSTVLPVANDGRLQEAMEMLRAEAAEQARPDIIERLTYHALERDDLTLDDCLAYLAEGWKRVRGRTERQMVLQLTALLAGAPAAEQAEPVAPQTYDDTLMPFLHLMRTELHANAAKGDRPGWLSMDRSTALLEIYWHTAKLSAAVKNNNHALIAEHSADVGNMAMMLADVCGVLPEYAPPAPAPSAPSGEQAGPVPSIVADVLAELAKAVAKFPTWPTDPLHALAVLGEEFGELTKDVLQLCYEPHKTTPESARKEAMQTAAMALRFAMSLGRYEYRPGQQHAQGEA